MNQNQDKFEVHYRQQLSALADGDLAPDQARFLLRRLQHDAELNGCWERWQLCGDVLRGQARAPAPAGFAERVAAAIAREQAPAAAMGAAPGAAPRSRNVLVRWGGGALAASVALAALFMTRGNLPGEQGVQPGMVASQAAPAPAVAAVQQDEASDAMATAAEPVASVVPAVAVRQAQADARGSATRTQQVARAAARRAAAPLQQAVASAPAATVPSSPVLVATATVEADPFRPTQPVLSEPVARPWPRASLPAYPSASGAFNASFGSDRVRQSFHPFEPQLRQDPPLPVPVAPQQ